MVFPTYQSLKSSSKKKSNRLKTIWDFEMDEEDLPENYTAGCAKKKWWKCSSCGFSWQAAIGDRTKGSGCPRCAPQQKDDKT